MRLYLVAVSLQAKEIAFAMKDEIYVAAYTFDEASDKAKQHCEARGAATCFVDAVKRMDVIFVP